MVTVHATSDYLVRGASQWVAAWQRNGWRSKGGDPIKNRSEWEALVEAARPHQVTWQFVKSKDAADDLTEAKRLDTEEAKLGN